MIELVSARVPIRSLAAIAVSLILLLGAPALAQETPVQEATPDAEFEEQTGRRLGDIPNDQIRQFRLRRACELDLPECPPAIREILEQERKNRIYMSGLIIGIFVLVILVMIRASQQKDKENKKLAREFKSIGQRVKKYKGAGPADEDDPTDEDPGLKGGVR